MDIKLAKTKIRKQVGGSLLTSILTLGTTLAPTLGKTLGLSALAGLASEGASQIVKKISGSGQIGGFLIPNSKIDQLIAYKHLLTTKQKQDILNSLQSGGQIVVKPTKSQYGGFLGTLLASIGLPLAIEAIPFIGSWEQVRKGGGKKSSQKNKKVRKRLIARQKQSLQQYTTPWNDTVKTKFHKNRPISNYDLLKWCKYLNIPINNVLSRDESLPHNHKQALFIYNLEPSYMGGSHWVAIDVKNGIINYFDSFGMPPFQEIVDHARKKNLILLHQNNQIQNINTTTCG